MVRCADRMGGASLSGQQQCALPSLFNLKPVCPPAQQLLLRNQVALSDERRR